MNALTKNSSYWITNPLQYCLGQQQEHPQTHPVWPTTANQAHRKHHVLQAAGRKAEPNDSLSMLQELTHDRGAFLMTSPLQIHSPVHLTPVLD